MTMRALPPLRPYPWPPWEAVLEECPPKYFTRPSPDVPNRLPAILRLAKALGFPDLQPWQKLVIILATEHIDGVPLYRKIIFTLPRRPGKTATVVVLITDAAIRTGSASSIVYAAQGGKETRERLEKDFFPIWKRSKFEQLYRMTLRKQPIGDVALAALGAWINTWGGSEVSAHGAGNLLVVGDELFAHTNTAVEGALIPSIKEEPKAQQIWTSARGTPRSVVLEDRIRQGRAAVLAGECRRKGIAYVEFGAPDEIEEGSEAEADPKVHAMANPAIGYTLEAWKVMDAFHDLSRADFRRMELNLLASTTLDTAIPLEYWHDVQVRIETPKDLERAEPKGGVVLGLAVEGDRRNLATAVAADETGRVMLVERWKLDGDGTKLVDWAKQVGAQRDLRGIAIGDPGPLAVYGPAMEDAGINVFRYSAGDFKEACGYFVDQVVGEGIAVVHHREMDDAVASAIRWPQNAKQGFVWGWADPAANLSSLWAATMAVHGAKMVPEVEQSYAGYVIV